MLSPASATLRSSGASASCSRSPAALLPVQRGASLCARGYNVDVEPDRARAPDNAPRWGGGPPPPPPPPPPTKPASAMQPPTRRELLFGFLGAGLGVLGASAIYNRPMSEEEAEARLTEVLDELLDDERLLNLVGEELLFSQQQKALSESASTLSALKELDDGLTELQKLAGQ